MGDAAREPVSCLPRMRSSSNPTQTPVTHDGVNPTQTIESFGLLSDDLWQHVAITLENGTLAARVNAEPGDPVSARLFAADADRLYGLDLFEKVDYRLVEQDGIRGVEYLAQSLPLVLEKYPQARVLFVGPYQNVVGEEEYVRRLAPLIKQLGEHWSFLGVISPVEMAAFFHECEVTILPSINSTESYGLVQVESITCGTPVIASDLPGVRVPVTKTGMGRIVPAANSEELARSIIAVLENPQAYRGHPEKLVRFSTPESVAMEYETAFESAANIIKQRKSQKASLFKKLTG